MVVDDHVDSAELLELVLQTRGATVRIFHTGASALEALQSFHPDVLLLDITLPDMDGYELLGMIRAVGGSRMVPAVALTGYADERDRKKSLEAGFAVHTAKPIDTEALIHLVAKLVKPSSTSEPKPILDELAQLLDEKDVVGVLRFLNARMPHRYTALYRYDGTRLRNVALFDRLEPSTTKGGDVPVERSFCWLVERDRASFITTDGSTDSRTAGLPLPLREDVKAYCGTLVRNADGTPFGSLCHFDHVPRAVPEGELAFLEELAPALARVVAVEVF